MLNRHKAGRLLILLLAMVLAFGAVPAMAENESVSGTFYVSLSNDSYFVVSDGKISGKTMSMFPVSLAEVSKINLDDYYDSEGKPFGYYNYDADGDGKYEITMLHVMVYLLENYYSGGVSGDTVISGGQGSFFMNHVWGHDCNLVYYVNGSYPLESEGWGATADHILVKNGDFVTIGMLTDWNFYSDPNAGHCYFGTVDGEIDWTQTATAGEDFQIRHIRRWGNLNIGGASESMFDADVDVYYSKTLYGDDAESTWTDSDGIATLNFTSAGKWYVWTDGIYGQNTRGLVATPAYAEITVEAGAAKPGDVNGDGQINITDAAKLYAAYNGKGQTTAAELAAMDINGDGKINITDAAKLYAAYNGKTTLS